MTDDPMKQLLQAIFDRMSGIEANLNLLVDRGENTQNAIDATPRVQDETGEWVFDITGLKVVQDRETGEDGAWVKTKKGKSVLCDMKGKPFFARKEAPV